MTVKVKITRKQLEILGSGLRGKARADALDSVGALLVARFQKSWRLQASPSGESWGERMTPNVPGIVKDLNAGGNPKARRFTPGQALVDTGQLRRSITFQVSGDKVKVGTTTSYAAIHNEGGESTVTLTGLGREKLKLWLRRERKGARDPDKLSLGWLFSRPTFSINVRKRTFIEIGPEERRIAKKTVEEAIARSLRTP